MTQCTLTDNQLDAWIAVHVCGWKVAEKAYGWIIENPSGNLFPCDWDSFESAKQAIEVLAPDFTRNRNSVHEMLEAVADRGVEAKNLFMACLILDGKQDGHVFDLLLTEPRELCEAAYETFKNSVTKET